MTTERMTREWWRFVVGNTAYAVSNLGKVQRMLPGYGATVGRILKPSADRHGYFHVSLNRGRPQYVAALVCHAWIGLRPAGYEINHKDGRKENNALENLEYVTPSQNMQHASATGLIEYGKLTADQVREIRWLWKEGGVTQRRLAEQYDVGETAVYNILHWLTWWWVV